MNNKTKRQAMSGQNPPRLRRADSFFGLHFDFHARKDNETIGKRTTLAMVEKIIDMVQPDYLQCDCKGHAGISSYPTKAGNPAPSFAGDPLRVWRQATAKRGVALFLHYSGVWDSEAVRQHPTWARRDSKGKSDGNMTSVFGPYVDKLLIPQLRELANDYGVDGVWIDGECWATAPDWGAKAVREFKKKTGISRVPEKAGDGQWFEFLQFCRAGFRDYLRHYVDELHRQNPELQIASNWAFSSLMPERVSANVDFLSGDFSSLDSVNTARFDGRCLARQGLPWDLMAWSFAVNLGSPDACLTTKSAVQLQREAAIVLALGGGFQAYFAQHRDGSAALCQMEMAKEVAQFCRDRQKFCHHAEAVPQIALLYSTANIYRISNRLFGPWDGGTVPLQGTLQALLESQQAVEVLSEHNLSGRMNEYPLIIVPECEHLEVKFKTALLGYVRAGGKLLVIGPKAAALFRRALSVQSKKKPEEKCVWLQQDDGLSGWKTLAEFVQPVKGTKAFGRLFESNDTAGVFHPAATITSLGKGKIAALHMNFGERYRNAATATARKFLHSLVRELFPNPLVDVANSTFVDVSVNRLRGKLHINLVNTSGDHANQKVHVTDHIPIVEPLQVNIRLSRRPRRIVAQPGNQALKFTFHNGELRLKTPRLAIHLILVVEE